DPVAHFWLRWPPQDSTKFTPDTLRTLGREALKRMGVDISRHQYLMTVHGATSPDPHLHIILNRVPTVARRVGRDGRMHPTACWNAWHSKTRAISVCRAMEKDHPGLLTVVEMPKIPKRFNPTRGEKALEAKTGKPCPRRELFDAVMTALKDTAIADRDKYREALQARGITVKYKIDAGNLHGVRFVDRHGKEWKSTKVHKNLTVATFQDVWTRHTQKEQRVAQDQRWSELKNTVLGEARSANNLQELKKALQARGITMHETTQGLSYTIHGATFIGDRVPLVARRDVLQEAWDRRQLWQDVNNLVTEAIKGARTFEDVKKALQARGITMHETGQGLKYSTMVFCARNAKTVYLDADKVPKGCTLDAIQQRLDRQNARREQVTAIARNEITRRAAAIVAAVASQGKGEEEEDEYYNRHRPG
ncbi:MAG: relaxase/mobilization nuclease domain-containing protein, partial [Syntrophorhabdus aromaticivorans]|nr:relaxase/mobilization nuclease domain-containing protein [Syntrophorhabdus aromaticivorans]